MTASPPIRFALLGAGRMGLRHAENLQTIGNGVLAVTFDPVVSAAEAAAAQFGGRFTDNLEDILGARDVDAVIVATPTDTHLDLILAFARAGKPVICEKPLSMDLHAIRSCRSQLPQPNVPIQVAFNRRYDVGHAALAAAVAAGEIGKIRFCSLTSRDWMPPPPGYIARSGGIFHDMMIHDFDMVRFITGEEPVMVQAAGSALFLDDAREHGDVDTAAVILTLASGAICQINCSRQSAYGHDQRIEVLGETGMLISQNQTPHNLERYGKDHTGQRTGFFASSRDRYRDAYKAELADFASRLASGAPPAVTFDDGYRATLIAEAARQAWTNGKAVAIDPAA